MSDVALCKCGKVRYPSKAGAKAAARNFRGPRHGKVRAYRCPGGFWHLTSATAQETAYFRRMAAS